MIRAFSCVGRVRPGRFLTLALSATVVLASAVSCRAADLYAPRSVADLRRDVQQWLARHGIKDQKNAARIAELWAPDAVVPGRDAFERVIQTFCLADPATRQFVEAASPGSPLKLFPSAEFLTRDEPDQFYTANLRLFYARSLAQRLMYDEALGIFSHLDPATVVDPATCLFYEAVCQHQLLMKKQGLETLEKLLKRTEGLAEPYARIAPLMQEELEALDERSLQAVSRKMQDSGRRLDLGRSGQRVQKVQEEIVESLDEIIKRLEQQANQQSQSSQGDNNSNRSSGPAEDSSIKGATAPGNVDKRDLKKQGSWGNLGPKEIKAANQALDRDFPSNYKRAVEEYFKRLATKPASK